MSWMDMPPCKIIPVLNRINAAVLERLRYTNPDYLFAGYETIILPLSRSNSIGKFINQIRSGIRQLYKCHFPVSNFGKWSKRRPYGELSDEELDLAIANELASAGIEPAGFFWERPHKYSDGNFVRACYHLLNNVLLYALGASEIDSQYFTQSMKTERITIDGEYILTHEGNSGLNFGYAAFSRQSDGYALRHIDRRFVISGSEYPKLQGNWKAKYHISFILKELLYPIDSKDKTQSFSARDVGTFEINFSGSQSDFIPWYPTTIENINTYYSRSNEKYGYAYAYEVDSITKILINRENFPPPNYQYID